MTRLPIHILLVEDNATDVRSIWNMIREKSSFEFTLEAVSRLPAAFERLTQGGIDIILLDLSLVTPTDETNATESLMAVAPHVAIIVLTVLQNEHEGLQALEAGAQDYLLKEEMGTRALVRALPYAVERKRLEGSRYATQQRLQRTIDGITEYAIVTLDKQGNITDWSAGAEHVFGYTANDILGKAVDLLFTPEDQCQHIPQYELQLAVDTGVADEDRWFVHKEGRLLFGSGKVFPLRDETGQVTGFIKVCRDITPQKHADEERSTLLQREQAALHEAKVATEALEKSLALLAHELRTPLTSIKGFATTLLAEYPTFDAPTWHQFVQIIDEEADKLTELTALLFDLVRMRAGVFPIQPERTHLEDIWATAQAQARVLTQKHQLILDLSSGLSPVIADRQRIAQVLTNLIGNAAKFSPPETQIVVRAKPTTDFIQIEVSDQGIGIPVQDRERIFKAFEQVETQHRRQGAGLGTAISKGIVEAHGGHIWVEDRSAPGTTIAFTLPIAQ